MAKITKLNVKKQNPEQDRNKSGVELCLRLKRLVIFEDEYGNKNMITRIDENKAKLCLEIFETLQKTKELVSGAMHFTLCEEGTLVLQITVDPYAVTKSNLTTKEARALASELHQVRFSGGVCFVQFILHDFLI